MQMLRLDCQSLQQAFLACPCWQLMSQHCPHGNNRNGFKLLQVQGCISSTEACVKYICCCMQDVFQEEEAIQVCIYCHHPCDAEVSGFEPAWTCAWCRVHAHVSCYLAYHDEGAQPAEQSGGGPADGAGRCAASLGGHVCMLRVSETSGLFLAQNAIGPGQSDWRLRPE